MRRQLQVAGDIGFKLGEGLRRGHRALLLHCKIGPNAAPQQLTRRSVAASAAGSLSIG